MDHKREDRTPPLAMVMRVGRQQQQNRLSVLALSSIGRGLATEVDYNKVIDDFYVMKPEPKLLQTSRSRFVNKPC